MNMKKELPCEMVRRDIEELIIGRKLTVDTLTRVSKNSPSSTGGR